VSVGTVALAPAERARERSVGLGLALDAAILSALIAIGLLGGSLTILAESIRATLMAITELLALLVMRRIHRGAVTGMEYGTGKLEQGANLLIGAALAGAALWVAAGAVHLLAGDAAVASPLGLTLGAITAAVNCYVNYIAWNAVRRAARGGGSLIMEGQLRARTVKLVSSMLVQGTLTVAALSTDDVVVAAADAAGSLLVAAVMTVTGLRMVRSALPDLLDRSPGETVRRVVERTLAAQPGGAALLGRLRARRSGGTLFVELTLSFDPALTVAEVGLRTAALRDAVCAELPQADVAIQLG
jgi:divalent metal cation (Fe/Co/Zn/Cd) transporter